MYMKNQNPDQLASFKSTGVEEINSDYEGPEMEVDTEDLSQVSED